MKIQGTNFTFGADPEIFVSKNNKFKSAHGMVEGDKANPLRVEKGAVQVDGMALEFNIDPAENFEQFQNNLDVVQQQLKAMIGDHEFMTQSSVFFDQELFDAVPEENKELGCDPDFNAWTERENQKPEGSQLMRTAGGHVHVGGFGQGVVDDYVFIVAAKLTRIMDETLGIYSLFWDHDDERRKMYGAAGAFRPKPYGMEYRSLSNAWIFKPQLVRFVYDGAVEALNKMFDPGYDVDPEIRAIIDNSDRQHPMFRGNEKVEQIKEIMAA